MFENYFKIALRNLMRHKVYSVINILSLALGMASCMVIVPQVLYHMSFDRFNRNYDRICRVTMHLEFPGQNPTENCGSSGWHGRDIKAEFPEVEDYARIFYSWDKVMARAGEKEIGIPILCYSENSLFRLFSFEFAEGDSATALSEPTGMVLSQETAKSLFGDEKALGRTVTLQGSNEYKVTGVLKKIPSNSHLRFDMLVPLTRRWPLETLESYQGLPDYYTYLLLSPGTNYRELVRKIAASGLLKRAQLPGVRVSGGARLDLQPLNRVHLYSSHIEYDNLHWRKANITHVLIFAAVALLMLVVACINFINLATARSTHRAREVGVRKVVGASRAQLVRQFLCESILISLLAVIAAQVLIEISRPLLNQFLVSNQEISFAGGWRFFLLMTVVTVVVGLLSGWYPALFLSLPKPQDILKGGGRGTVKGLGLRRALVVVQFSASIFLIVCSLFILKQLRWISQQDLGYNRERVLTIRMMSPAIQARYPAVRNAILSNGSVTGVCASGISPLGKGIAGAIMHFEGQVPGELWITRYMSVDPEFIPFFGLEMAEGRAFSSEMGTDTSGAYIINETLKRKLGWDKAVGKKFWLDTKAGQGLGLNSYEPGRVIGVVRDFNFSSLHNPIEPLALVVRPSDFYYLSVRLKPQDVQGTRDYLEKIWNRLDPGGAFESWFLNDDIEWQYQGDKFAGQLVTGFTVLCVLIACLGLLGLVSLAAERRTKEIGIRKVLGASMFDVILLLSREFMALLSIAILIAWPAAWWIMNRWLQNFAYRTDLDWYTFVLAGVIALAVAAATVSFQAVRAATADPIQALRYE